MVWTDYLRSELVIYELKRRQSLCEVNSAGQKQSQVYQSLIDKCPKAMTTLEMAQFFTADNPPTDLSSIQNAVNFQIDAYSREDNPDSPNGKLARDVRTRQAEEFLGHKPMSIVTIEGKRYLLKKTLGRGVCGVAKKAVNLEDGTEVVVKIVRPVLPYLSSIALQSALNEEKILKELRRGGFFWVRQLGADWHYRNSGLGNLMRAGFIKEKIYTVQDLMPGYPLDKVVDDYTTASKEDVVRLLVAITKSLNNLHRNNIFHGDIKFENILFDGTSAHFIDFGLSCKTDEFGMVRQDSNLIMHNAPYAFLRQRQTVGFFHQETTEWKNGSTLSLKTDVYALGKTFQQLIKKIGLNDPKINALINSMCKDKSEERPSLTQVEQSFGLIISGWASRELLEKSSQPEGEELQAQQSGLIGKL